MLSTKEFLLKVVTPYSPEPIPLNIGFTGAQHLGYFVLAVGNNGSGWKEEWYSWPADIDTICEHAQAASEHTNVYFSTYLFAERASTKDNVLPTRTIQADLDGADVRNLPLQPQVLVQTSPGRHQGFWVLDEPLDLEIHEVLSRKLTYSIAECDHSGWPLGRKVRLPNSYNYKYIDGRKPVDIVSLNNSHITLDQLEMLPEAPRNVTEVADDSWLDAIESMVFSGAEWEGPNTLLETVKDRIPPQVYLNYNIVQADRSAALWALINALFRAGLSKDQVYYIAESSANNKFTGLKYHASRELAKDVLRGQRVVSTHSVDPREVILSARKLKGSPSERKAYIAQFIIKYLENEGTFVHTDIDQCYYIRNDIGRPIVLAPRSEHLNTLLNITFGLNTTEEETRYVISAIYHHAHNLPDTWQEGVLNHLVHHPTQSDSDLPTTMLLHTGRKDVLEITATTVRTLTDGSHNMVFQWPQVFDPVQPDFEHPSADWARELFGDLNNILDMPPESGLALLKVWLMFLFFRDLSIARPILALFGQPGCLSKGQQISVKRGDHSPREYPIETVYRAFNGGTHNTRYWHPSISTKIMSLKDGVVTWRAIDSVVASGVKQVYHVTTSNGRTIDCTRDHKFLMLNGTYEPLINLNYGDSIVIRGEPLGGVGRTLETRKMVSAKYHPYASQFIADGNLYLRALYSRLVIEAENNNLSVDEYITILNTDEQRSLTFDFLSPHMIVHHKDEHPSNDTRENLEVLTQTAHDQLHGKKNQRNLKKFSGLYGTTVDTIQSIVFVSEQPTYDIVMKDEDAPNFCVDNIVVHNSSKSTTFRKVYAFLYGKRRSVTGITDPGKFDHSVARDPLVVFDNVDTWEKWLPDRLALTAAASDVTIRKLYSDTDTIILKRQALVGLSAHAPKFGREDVADRLLLLNFSRLTHFIAEGDIISNVTKNRNKLWAAVIQDIQKVLATPMPTTATHDDIPQIRVEDFAKLGYWIATALDCKSDFIDAVNRMRQSQKVFSLEEEMLLVIAIRKLIEADIAATIAAASAPHLPEGSVVTTSKWRSSAELFTQLEYLCGDVQAFTHLYKNAIWLGRKLWSLQDSLQEVFKVEWRNDSAKQTRIWRFNVKLDAQHKVETSNS